MKKNKLSFLVKGQSRNNQIITFQFSLSRAWPSDSQYQTEPNSLQALWDKERALGPPSQASETAYFIYIDLFFLEADIPQAKVIYQGALPPLTFSQTQSLGLHTHYLLLNIRSTTLSHKTTTHQNQSVIYILFMQKVTFRTISQQKFSIKSRHSQSHTPPIRRICNT